MRKYFFIRKFKSHLCFKCEIFILGQELSSNIPGLLAHWLNSTVLWFH